MTEWLTEIEVSERYKVSRGSLQRWRRLGNGPPWVYVGRSVRYDLAQLEEWLKTRHVWIKGER